MMKARINYYLFVIALVILDSVLLTSPNLLGKIGLIIYHYHYLRTFPKTLLTVTLVVGAAASMGEVIRFSVKKEIVRRLTGGVLLFLFMLVSIIVLIKTGLDFTKWSYEHTGLRFRLGAYLLPAILVLVFSHAWYTLPKASKTFPEFSEANDDKIGSIK